MVLLEKSRQTFCERQQLKREDISSYFISNKRSKSIMNEDVSLLSTEDNHSNFDSNIELENTTTVKVAVVFSVIISQSKF